MPATVRRPGKRLAPASGTGMSAHHAPPRDALECDATTQVVMGLARKDPGVWFENYGRIVNKDSELVKPKINVLQRRLLEVWRYCQKHDLPCSIIICKPRQKGSSTISMGITYHILRSSEKHSHAGIIGGKDKQVDSLWGILDTYASNDQCQWGTGGVDIQAKNAYIGKGIVSRETAGNPDAGRAHTFRVGIVTELGRWRSNGVANASKVLSGFLACCHRRPGTLRVIESTAQGIGGEFHSRYFKALPAREFLAGKRNEGGWVRVFAAWFEFPDSWKDLTDEEKAAMVKTLDAEEKALIERYDLTLEQLAWRRDTIEAECDGDVDKFHQEYPSNENEAFLSSGRPRFDRVALDLQDALAERYETEVMTGDLSISEDFRVSWTSLPAEESVIHCYERPYEGREYLLVLDPATGATQAMGQNPDCHSALVIRRGYYDREGNWHPPALAMRIRPPRKDYKFACRWDADVLTDAIYKMALYYGNCRIVIEMNKDIGVTELLKAKREISGAPHPRLYQREVFNEREQRKVKALGWLTTTGNREALVNTLAGAIRSTGEPGAGVELRCAHAIRECYHFEIGDKGKSEAASGHHDDDVMAWAIGLTCLEQATPYHEPRVSRLDPPEIRRLEAGRKKKSKMYS